MTPTFANLIQHRNGKAFIKGTVVPVWVIAEARARYYATGAEIHAAYPHLSLDMIYAALEYADEHKDEIDREIEANSLEE